LSADFYSRLISHAGLSALVGDRIYPLVLPQNTALPAVVYQRISGQRIQNLTRDTGGPQRIRVQLTAWAEDVDTANSVAEQVRQAMEAATGWRALHALDVEQYEPDTGLYSVVADYLVHYP
jgi:hypothetical protein